MKTAKLKEREFIISMHNKSKSSYEIADILDISQTKASFWIRRYKKTGSLNDMPRSGRPTPLSEKKLKNIASLISKKLTQPENKKIGVSTKEVLMLIKTKTKKEYSLRHVERAMHKMGFSLITPRPSHIKKDENAKEKFKVEFKKNLNRNIWAIH
jgi:transposase